MIATFSADPISCCSLLSPRPPGVSPAGTSSSDWSGAEAERDGGSASARQIGASDRSKNDLTASRPLAHLGLAQKKGASEAGRQVQLAEKHAVLRVWPLSLPRGSRETPRAEKPVCSN